MLTRTATTTFAFALALTGCASMKHADAGMNDVATMQRDATSAERAERPNKRAKRNKRGDRVVRMFQDELDDGTLILEAEEDRIELLFAHLVHFDTADATLHGKDKRALNKIAKVLKEHPSAKIGITGHADSRPVTSGPYLSNAQLSLDRARAVKDYLFRRGIDTARMQLTGASATDPVAAGADIAQTYNRRVEVRILPDFEQVPAVALGH